MNFLLLVHTHRIGERCDTKKNTRARAMMTTTTSTLMSTKKTRLKKNPRLTEDVVANTRIQFQHDDELLHTVRVKTALSSFHV